MKVQVNTVGADWQLGEGHSKRTVVRAPSGRLWSVYPDALITESIYVSYSDDNGTTWTEEKAVNDARLVGAGQGRIVLLVDSSSVPIILYLDNPVAGNDRLVYVDRNGGTWGAVENIYQANSIGEFDACMDANDKIHIAFTRTGLRYIKGSTGSWAANEVAIAGSSPGDETIAVDSNDKPYIVYNESDGLYMVEKTGASWSGRETIENTYGNAVKPGIAMDVSNNLHVAWYDYSAPTFYILYRKRQGGTWQTQITVTSQNDYDYEGPNVSIDTSGNIYIVYCFNTTTGSNTIWYKKITGISLGSEATIDDTLTRPGNRSSLACSLYHKYPSSGIPVASAQPVVILLDANSNADIYYEAAGVFSVSYPTDTVARVSSIRHIFRPSSFRMQVMLGDLGFDVDIADSSISSVEKWEEDMKRIIDDVRSYGFIPTPGQAPPPPEPIGLGPLGRAAREEQMFVAPEREPAVPRRPSVSEWGREVTFPGFTKPGEPVSTAKVTEERPVTLVKPGTLDKMMSMFRLRKARPVSIEEEKAKFERLRETSKPKPVGITESIKRLMRFR